jgi:MFS family permease
MSASTSSLWRHPDFLRLWTGQAISRLGSSVAGLAIPLIAAITLEATPTEMGILGAAWMSPFLVVGLLAGVWVDRLPRRPILILADLGHGLLLALIVVGATFGLLRMEHLYVAGFLLGVLSVFFEVGLMAYLPTLVGRDRLVEANSKLEMGGAAVRIGGPGVGGALISLVGAPLVVVVDAVSYLLAGALTWAIRAPESPPQQDGPRRSVWREMGDGFGVIFGDRYLRSIAPCTATFNLFNHVSLAVWILFMTRDLGLDPFQLGLMGTAGSLGVMLGASKSGKISRRLGLGQTIVAAIFVSSLSRLLVPLFAEPGLLAIAVPIVASLIGNSVQIVYDITQLSFRQSITPHHLQGRTNAAQRFIVWGTMPIGALIGGLLGDQIGLRATMLVGGVGTLFAVFWIFFSPVRTLRHDSVPPLEAPAAP